jgi:hypothetical protein
MFAKNFADAARIQSALTQLKREGFVAHAHEKWFGAPPPVDSASVQVLEPPK